MIRSFRNRDLKKAWELGKDVAHKNLPARETYWVLDALNAANAPREVAFLGRFFEWDENGERRYGVAITDHWTVSFGWSGGHAVEVDLEWHN
jgi:plasmid maintenance system killer protein